MNNHRNRQGKYSAEDGRKVMSLPLLILLDVLMVGLIMGAFMLAVQVIPAWISNREAQLQASETTIATSVETTEPTTVPETTEVPSESTEEVTEAPTEDTRTEWQKKFADHFTDEVVITDHSYSSPNIAIDIRTETVDEGGVSVYHVADIYVASLDHFVTATANNEMRYYVTQDIDDMDMQANAILSISGDFLTVQKSGFLMRNKEIYVSDTNMASICVLFEDGTIETYDGRQYDVQEIIDRGAVQVWSFGPNLLDKDGKVRSSYKVSTAVAAPNPRSAIGYYEPGHYCFVVVDGRQKGYSKGLRIPELAKVFEDLGCVSAYNLDGGGSAAMIFNHERFSKQSNGGDRKLGDILVIRESAPQVQEGQQ